MAYRFGAVAAISLLIITAAVALSPPRPELGEQRKPAEFPLVRRPRPA